jgi:hypoxanthine-DNA glycosylase
MHTLILGTFPPHKSKRKYEFYYPNTQNRFWKILAEIAGRPLTFKEGAAAVAERKKLMEVLNVGVQNVAKTIRRKGKSSLDENIEIVEYQDLLSIIETHESLRTVLLTGFSGTSSTYSWFVQYLNKVTPAYYAS